MSQNPGVPNDFPKNLLDDRFDFIQTTRTERQQSQRWRSLRVLGPPSSLTPGRFKSEDLDPDGAGYVRQDDRWLLNFSSNDYLGLATHPALIAAAQDYAQRYGVGATASRLVTGTYDIHAALEQALAQACGREAALLFSSGFQANATVLPALLTRHSLVLVDRLSHHSLLHGAIASQARLIRYRHNDLNHLETLLQQAMRHSYDRCLIVTESVFSMDGDRGDVEGLVSLADRYGALLYVDEAHAWGVLGPGGMGLAANQLRVDLVLGTFGKAWGSFGAFIACSQALRDYLTNMCPGFIYTTALPPPIVGSLHAALTLMPHLEQARQTLLTHAATLRARLQGAGYDTGPSNTQIVPLWLGEEERALGLAQWLEKQGILAIAIRPPTVPAGTSRLRLVVSAQHQAQHLDLLLDAICAWPG
ncbi:8-amino-7-oxononanoate synthase [Trichothermofontia sp.]